MLHIQTRFVEYMDPEAEFKEFEPRHQFERRLKHDWFQLKLYSVFRFEPALNWNRILAFQLIGLNSLSSASDQANEN